MRVRIGDVPDTILQTRIPKLIFDVVSQYNSAEAISAIGNAPEVIAAMRAHKITTPVLVIGRHVFTHPRASLPHMPEELSNVTKDQALDVVAKTWGDVVFHGACTKPATYVIL